jgi:uncharacterized protein YjiS (DUF1127 family)
MITISKVTNSVGRFFESMGKARVNSWLLRMGPEWVENNGYSYEALRGGISKWPWRRAPEKVAEEKELKRIIRELKSYNDRELADIGIPRSGIEDAVRHGRPGYECDLEQNAA